MDDNVGRRVVPFGKYKGQPVEALQADPKYIEWLASYQSTRSSAARAQMSDESDLSEFPSSYLLNFRRRNFRRADPTSPTARTFSTRKPPATTARYHGLFNHMCFLVEIPSAESRTG
jgi:uncharacterized protein (DUF3820 family)